MKGWLAILALFLGFATPLSARSPDSDVIQDILERVKADEDKVDRKVFDQLGQMGDERSFDALQKAIIYLRKQGVLNRAYSAFRHYKGKPELEPKAIAYLRDEVMGHRRDENQTAALRALFQFGPAAHEEVERVLMKHRDPDLRRLAIGPLLPTLGERADEASARLILDYADIGNGATRDQVFQALTRCKGKGVHQLFERRLRDKSQGGAWKLLLLDVIVDREGVEIDKMVYARIDDEDFAVRVRAVEIVGLREYAPALKKLKKLLRTPDPELLHQLIISITAMESADPDWLEEVIGFAEDENFGGRLGAAVALVEIRTPGAVEVLYGMLADENWRVRAQVLEGIGRLRRKSSLPPLIARLDLERGRLKRDIASLLRILTALDNGTSTARWGKWWDEQGEAFELPDYEFALDKERERVARREASTTQSTFYGLEIVSERVAFVLDVSGSMSTETKSSTDYREKARTRLAVAKEELSAVIQSLREGLLFNLLFFSRGVSPWQDEMVSMDAEAREDALGYVNRQKAAGGTNVFDALMLAFGDERVDTIYLLTDGQPSSGSVTNTVEIRDRVLRLNRFRKVQINTISVGRKSAFLEGLAADNGGTYAEAF